MFHGSRFSIFLRIMYFNISFFSAITNSHSYPEIPCLKVYLKFSFQLTKHFVGFSLSVGDETKHWQHKILALYLQMSMSYHHSYHLIFTSQTTKKFHFKHFNISPSQIRKMDQSKGVMSLLFGPTI